jgi:hypothetical protein
MRFFRPDVSLLFYFIIVFVGHFGLTGCSGADDTTLAKTCEGHDEDCRCQVDDDCVLSRYELDVGETMNCTMKASCCDGGWPRNSGAEARFDRNYQEQACMTLEQIDCAICDGPHFVAFPACHNGRCGQMRRTE